VADYAKRDGRIVAVLRESNIGVAANFADLARRARGEYVALCEGDDYWIHPGKLQKQARFLDDHLEYSIVFHPVEVVFWNEDIPNTRFPADLTGAPMAWQLASANFIQTNSVMYRWRFPGDVANSFSPDMKPLDWFVHLMHAEVGRIGYQPEVMGVYRRHPGGMWADSQNPKVHRRRHGRGELVFFREIRRHFGGMCDTRSKLIYQNLFNDLANDLTARDRFDELATIVCDNPEIAASSFLPLEAADIPVRTRTGSDIRKLIASRLKISVVILTYNHERYIRHCLDTVLEQRGPFQLEIIVGDDCSSDGTRGLVEEHAAQTGAVLKLITSDKNVGMLKNMQRCLAACSGHFIAFCEGDDYWLSDRKLLRQLQFLLQRPSFAMCFNWVVLKFEEEGILNPHPEQALLGEQVALSEIARQPVTANFSCCFYRASAVRAVPDEFYSTVGAADWLFNIYAAQSGGIGFLRELLSVYRLHPDGLWTGMPAAEQSRSFREARKECSRRFGPARGFDEYRVDFRVRQLGGPELSRQYECALDVPRSGASGYIERDRIRFYGWVIHKYGKFVRVQIRRGSSEEVVTASVIRTDVTDALGRESGIFHDPLCGFETYIPFEGPAELYQVAFDSDGNRTDWLEVTAALHGPVQ
jgi:glycosyltransferase involved in cell wall biosynthesis